MPPRALAGPDLRAIEEHSHWQENAARPATPRDANAEQPAAGGLLGAGIASFLGRRLGTGTALTCTAAVEGLAILGLAAAPGPYVAGLALAVCGRAWAPRWCSAPHSGR
ncbi:hypothetical protein [Nonomuraea sp. NPDC023979]|uniref:hypothetical protein n=1 Tax=Nonomuraea sp. NPDC023979 TaxID=3154796 RepID=UPI0033EA396B